MRRAIGGIVSLAAYSEHTQAAERVEGQGSTYALARADLATRLARHRVATWLRAETMALLGIPGDGSSNAPFVFRRGQSKDLHVFACDTETTYNSFLGFESLNEYFPNEHARLVYTQPEWIIRDRDLDELFTESQEYLISPSPWDQWADQLRRDHQVGRQELRDEGVPDDIADWLEETFGDLDLGHLHEDGPL